MKDKMNRLSGWWIVVMVGLLLGLPSTGRYAHAEGVPCGYRSVISSLDIASRPYEIEFSDHVAYLAAESAGVYLIDVSNPEHPVELSVFDTPGYAYGLDIVGDLLYIADSTYGLHIVDVHDPAVPVLLGTFSVRHTPNVTDVVVVDGLAYISTGETGLQIVDVSNSSEPQLVSAIDTDDFARSLEVVGEIAYVTDWDAGVHAYDISDPVHPSLIGSYDTPGEARRLIVIGEVVIVADHDGGVHLIDFSDPTTPTLLSSLSPIEPYTISHDVAVRGSTLYVTNGIFGLFAYDLSDPAEPELFGVIQSDQNAIGVLLLDDEIACVLDEANLVRFVRIDPMPADPVYSVVNTRGVSWEVSLSGQIACVANGQSKNIEFIDVSDPYEPIQMGQFDTPENIFDVHVAGPLAFVGCRRQGLKIIDFSDPWAPVEIGSFSVPNATFGETAVDVQNGIAYVADADGGLQILDVSDPAAPTQVGWIATPGGASSVALLGDHVLVGIGCDGSLQVVDARDPTQPSIVHSLVDIECVEDIVVEGSIVYVDTSYDGTYVIDMTNPIDPIPLSIVPGRPRGIAVRNSIMYLSYGVNIFIYDARDPSSPSYFGRHRISNNSSGYPQKLFVMNGIAYVPDGGGTLTVIDVSDCPPCPADLNGDDLLNFADVTAFIDAFIASDPLADLNDDGLINFGDVTAFIDAFVAGC